MKLMALLRERDREERNKISKEPDAFQIQILYAQPLPILIPRPIFGNCSSPCNAFVTDATIRRAAPPFFRRFVI